MTFESMSSGTILPALVRKRTGTSLMMLPEPSCLKICGRRRKEPTGRRKKTGGRRGKKKEGNAA